MRLDFADLLALDALDDELRKAFLAVSQDVERLAKTSMVTRASRLDDEDGYGIVADFMRAQQRRYRSYIERDLSSRMSAGIVGDVYTGRIIGHYRDAMPVWAFLEVVTFGTALAFCLFCSERWDDAVMREEHYILKGVKAVRNCCSHGSCIVNGWTAPTSAITRFPAWSTIGSPRRRRQQQDAPRQVKEPSYAAAPRDARDVRPIGRAGALSPFDGAAGRAARESSRHVRELRRPERVRVVPEVSGESH
ncbi:MAG: Abi family protein [Eggerthellaceae bacterium]